MQRQVNLGVIGLLVVVLVGCGKEPIEKPIRPVRSIKVGDVQAIDGRAFPGRAKATDEVILSFRVSGPLIEFGVKVGQQVEPGDVLAVIDHRDFSVELLSAQANLNRVQANLLAMQTARPEDIRLLESQLTADKARFDEAVSIFKRNEPLAKNGVITEEELDVLKANRVVAEANWTAAIDSLKKAKAGARVEDIAAKEAEIKSLEAAVQNAQNRLEYTQLKAPFKGIITATYVENFETVQVRQQILRVVNPSKIEMTIDVPEQLISLVGYAKNIKCLFDAFPDVEIPAEIHEIGSEASQKTRTYPVTLIMDQPDNVKILPGMAGIARGRAELPEDVQSTGYEIPDTAILEGEGNKEFVWLIDEQSSTVKRHEVKRVVGNNLTPRGTRVTGLSTGQRVVTAGVHYLKQGQEVRVLQ